MKLRKINLDVCLKCQIEAGGVSSDFVNTSLVRLATFGNLNNGRNESVYWARNGVTCGELRMPNQKNRDFSDFLENRIYKNYKGYEDSRKHWIKCLKRSVRILKNAMDKFPCECIIADDCCPYLMEQIVLDANETSENQP